MRKIPKKTLYIGVGVAVVLLLIGIMVGSGGSGASGSKGPGFMTGVTPSSEPDESLCLDAHGSVTVYALTELDGKKLLDFIGDKGYSFVESDGSRGWDSSDESCSLVVSKGAGEVQLDEAGLSELAAGGAGDAVWYHLMCEGYDTAEQALTGLGQVTFEKRDALGDDVAYGIANSSRGERFFVMVQIYQGGDASVMVLNEGSLEAGVMAEQGKTVDELYDWCGGAGSSDATQGGGTNANAPDLVNGVFTTHAVLTHTGEELAALAAEQGFSYDEALGGYVDAGQKSFLGVLGTAGVLDETGIKKLPAGGGSEPVYFMVQAFGFDTAAQAFERLNSYKALGWVAFSDHTGSGVIEGPASKRYLVYVTGGEAETQSYTFCVLSDEAIGAGLFKEITKQDFGKSIDEVWSSLTGGTVGS